MIAKIIINKAGFHLFCLGLIILLSGCHAYVLDDAQHDLRSSFTSGKYQESSELLQEFERKEVYKSKDAVLKNLEAGLIHHFAGNFDSSSVFFDNAEILIDDAYTKSVSRGFKAMLVNDNTLVYDGEPYEDIYLNAFKSLNYIHQNNWEAALVETRRMAFKMEQLDIRLKGLAEAFSREDTTGNMDWHSGKVNIQNSAFSHYLASILYAKTGKPDDSRIEFEKLNIALSEQKKLHKRAPIESEKLEKIKDPNSYNVLITAFSGQAPIKRQEDFRLWLDGDDDENSFYVKFSLPKIDLYRSRVQSIRVVTDSLQPHDLELIEELDVVSAEVYKAKVPIIYTRSLLRATMKATGSTFIASSVRKKNKGLGFLVDVLGIIGQESSEKADLRGWQTMPGKAWMNVINLPHGINEVEIQYLSASGSILYSERKSIEIDEQTKLGLIESIYSY